MSRPVPVPRRFYAVAVTMGIAFATTAVGVPLHVLAVGGKASEVGAVLAASTAAIALGALLAGALGPLLRGGPRTLALALLVSAAGSLALLVAPSLPLIVAGAVLVGAGNGIFWVASQLLLGRRSGEPGSEHGFLQHYATYTFGTVLGSALTGVIAGASERLDLGDVTGIRISFALGLLAATCGLAVWRPLVRAEKAEPARGGGRRPRPLHGLVVQLPDLLLVGGLALLLPLAPVVLTTSFHFSSLAVGLVMGAVALAKIAGTIAARTITHSRGHRQTILILLGAGASLCFLLSLAVSASFFVVVLLATALAATGAWPLVVDAAQARVAPARRRSLTVLWNVREYGVIAINTAASGWLLTTVGRPGPVLAVAAMLFASAAVCSAVVLRRPVWRGEGRAPQPVG